MTQSQVTVLEEVCPRCRTSNYQNKSLKLLVNECGHDLCEKCVEHLFIRGSAPCPSCKLVLKKNGFKTKRFEDFTVEREVDIRKRILKDYNKTEEDFGTLREYNDYLEEIEEIIFNFASNIDVEETKAKVEAYKKENFKTIQKNRVAQSRQEAYLKEKTLAEEKEAEERRAHEQECELMEEMERQERKKKLLDQIASSDRPADEILLLHKEEEETVNANKRSLHSKSAYNSGFSIAMISNAKPSDTQVYIYKYEDCEGNTCGPKTSEENIKRYAETVNVSKAALAGGFLQEYVVHRPVDDAYSGLFIFND